MQCSGGGGKKAKTTGGTLWQLCAEWGKGAGENLETDKEKREPRKLPHHVPPNLVAVQTGQGSINPAILGSIPMLQKCKRGMSANYTELLQYRKYQETAFHI